ncbi:MAG: DUF927 domain-containing protein [Pseudomonadota bacterium]|nr:DUF927 domain-containing protein [Pseudomonadota bacterium]
MAELCEDSELFEEDPAPEELQETPQKMNDAVLLGQNCDAMQTLLQRPFIFMQGELFGSKDRRNTQDGSWVRCELNLIDWLAGQSKGANTWGLSRHPVAKRKEGRSLVLADALDGARNDSAIQTMYAVGIDIDSGAKLQDVLDTLVDKNLFAVVYTSFNHSKTELVLKHDEVIRKLKLDHTPNRTEVQIYLRDHHKDRYDEDFIQSIEVVEERKQTKDGLRIVLKTAPLDKFRVILPLAEPVELADLGNTVAEWKDAWADIVTGVAVNTLGVSFDSTSCDVNRLFYTPRHASGAEWGSYVVQGEPLAVEDVQRHSKTDYLRDRGETDPFSAGTDQTAEKETFLAPGGTNLNRWHVKHKARFLITDAVEHYADNRLRTAGNERQGTAHIECPFEHEHSSEGGTATMIMNPDENEMGYWTVFCKHDACQGREKLEFLRQMLEDGWFPEDGLTDEEFNIPLADQDMEPEGEGLDATWVKTPYIAKRGTIYLKATGDDGMDFPLCQTFEVLGRSSSLAGDSGAGRIISFKNENGVAVEMTLDRAALFKQDGGGVLDALADSGMDLRFRGRDGRSKMLDLLRSIKSDRQIPVVQHPGWTRDRAGSVTGFMCPTGEFIPAGADAPDMRLHSSATVKDRAPRGTLGDWQDAVRAAKLNFHWTFALAAAFVGPLLGLLEEQPCGVNLSGDSSRGKTKALLLATSVWTSAVNNHGVFFVMNSTSNAVEDLATIGTETFLGLDEIGAMANPASLGATLFGLSSAAGKNRKSGRGPGLAPTAEFRPFVLTTHERGLKATIKDAGGDYKTGLSVRFPDVDVTTAKTVGPDALAQLDKAKENFGHAGPAFIHHLILQGWHERPEALKARVSEAASQLAGPDAAPALKRAAQVFAFVQVAGELAAEAGLIDAEPLTPAVEAAFSVFAESDEGRATTGGDSLIDDFRSWVVRSLGQTLIQAEEAHKPGYQEVRGWYTKGLLILDHSLLADMKKMGLSGKRDSLLSALAEIGALEMSGKNRVHYSLPTDVDLDGGPKNRKVKNVRVSREVLGV